MNKRLFYIGLLAFLVAFVTLAHQFRIRAATYRDTFGVMAYPLAGHDFNEAYDSARQMKRGRAWSIQYPPLAVASYLPLTRFDRGDAYRIFTWIVLAALFLSVFLALRESRLFAPPDELLFAAMIGAAFYQSYWFQFELERGNCNIFVTASAMGGLLAMSRGRWVLSALLLAVATQLRLFPAILILLPILRYGWRPLAVFVGANLAGFLAMGRDRLGIFHRRIAASMVERSDATINHALKRAADYYGFSTQVRTIEVALVLLFLSLLAWYAIERARRPLPEGSVLSVEEVALFGFAVQLMDLLPPLSYDYKLGLQGIVFLLLITRCEEAFAVPTSVRHWIVGASGVSFGYLSVPGHVPKAPAIFFNVVLFGLLAAAELAARRVTFVVPAPTPLVRRALD